MQTFNLIAYNNATFRWTLDVSPLSDFFAAGGALHMKGTFPSGTSYEWIQGAASGGIINVSSAAGVYTALFTAPLKDTSLWFGKMTFDCRGELPGGAAIPIMSGAIDFRQGKTRLPDDATSTSISTIYDTVEGSGPALVLPVDWTATLNAARGYASDAAASAASAAVSASIAGAVASGSIAVFRNRLVNGNFEVWQRGASFSIGNGSSARTADGAVIVNSSTGVTATVSKVAAPSGFRGSQALNMAVTGGSAAGALQAYFKHEGRQIEDMAGQRCVLSFDILATGGGALSGTAYVAINSALDNSSWSAQTSVAFTVPAGAARVSVPFASTAMANAQNGAQFSIRVAQASAGDLSVTLGCVQFELDRQVSGAWNNPTSFEFLPLPITQTRCFRFFRRWTNLRQNFPSYAVGCIVSQLIPYPVEMRAAPTITSSVSGISYANCSGATFDHANTQSFRMYATSTATALNVYWLLGASDYVDLSAELN